MSWRFFLRIRPDQARSFMSGSLVGLFGHVVWT